MTSHSTWWKSAMTVAVVGGLFVFDWPALSAPPPPLPAGMQKDVDRAIDAGVEFLKQTQGPFGTWIAMGEHQVGYAALPGLTLLECGMKPSDPIVQKAAAFVRWSSGTLDRTYDLSLAILFLDKLGDPRDKMLIQSLALRLIAGQTGTGGWSYKCPILTKQDHNDVLKMLRKMNPPQLFMPLARQGDKPDSRSLRPGDQGLDKGIPGNGKEDLKGIPADSTGRKPSEKSLPRSPGTREGPDPSRQSESLQPRPPGKANKSSPRPRPFTPRPMVRCIKTADAPETDPPDQPTNDAPKPKAPRRANIPPHLLRVAVINDPRLLPLIDPRDKQEQPMWGTTDNSNSQFAILALWAARKHDVPMIRTLNLIARRYCTSQNFDGGWSYRYHFGGDRKTTPAMTCVGLLGLAVAHGLANELGAKAAAVPELVQDPRVVMGFLALHARIGKHTGAWRNLPMENLYFLWSVERVGVLFDLATIGDKDWYRWGAEILLANQQPNGNWDKGQYHGHTPALDTCLALLFLKRASLTGDLQQKLPFKPGDLAKAIRKESPPPAAKVKEIAASSKATAKLYPPAREPSVKPAESINELAIQKGNNLLPSEAPVQTMAAVPLEATPVEEEGSNAWAWVLVGVALLLLVTGGVVLLLPGRKKEVKKTRRRRTRRSPKLAES